MTKEADDASVVRRQNLYRTGYGDILVNVRGDFNGLPKITREDSGLVLLLPKKPLPAWAGCRVTRGTRRIVTVTERQGTDLGTRIA